MDVIEEKSLNIDKLMNQSSSLTNKRYISDKLKLFKDKRNESLSFIDNVISDVESKGFKSHDPYDLFEKGPIRSLRLKKNKVLSSITEKSPSKSERMLRAIISPVYQSSFVMSTYRTIFRIKKVEHPKSKGLLLQGYCSLYRLTHDSIYLVKAEACAKWLMENKDQNNLGYFCWGLPWEWLSDDHIPRFGAQSTMTAVIGLAFVELYEITENESYLSVAQNACDFFLDCLNIDKVSNDKWAVSYTPYDKTHILNVNFHCAALLVKVYEKTGKQLYLEVALKLCNFSIAEQRPDGAWHYSSVLDGYVNAVDNTHTGDNIEYLYIIRTVLRDKFPYEKEFQLGVSYYLNHFISDEGMPYFTDEEKYPVESHPACQMLISLALISDHNPEAAEKAVKLLHWVQKNLMNKQQTEIYYRKYDTGRIDKTASISWGSSWLVKGAALLVERSSKWN